MFATDIASLLPSIDSDDRELHEAIRCSLERLLASGQWANYQAPVLDELRNEIAIQSKALYVRLCSSGSLAMELAFRGVGIQAGDEVICPALDYPGNIRALRLLGAEPVVVDSLPGRWTIDPEQVACAGTAKTKAVVVSHLYGEIADVISLRRLCDDHGWSLIEDACQMPGTLHHGAPVGSFGDVAAFSFGGSKPLTAGCGGALATNDARVLQRIKAYADRPSDMFGFSPIQASVLLPQWQRSQALIQRQAQKLSELVTLCQAWMPRWQWPEQSPTTEPRCYYKIPLRIVPIGESGANERAGLGNQVASSEPSPESKSMRPWLVGAMEKRSIRAGEPFRVITRTVAGRGRVLSFANAERIANQSILIDHRHLAGASQTMRSFAERLESVYREQA